VLCDAVVTGNNKRPVKIPFAPSTVLFCRANLSFGRKFMFSCDAGARVTNVNFNMVASPSAMPNLHYA